MNKVVIEIRKELQRNMEETTKKASQKFFKETVNCSGVKMSKVHSISKYFLQQMKNENKAEIFSICEELFKSENLEESIIACDLAYAYRKSYESKDFDIFNLWLSMYINNWASCDTFCNHTIGAFMEQYPAYISKLKKWTKSENRWLRRAAAVSLIVPARRGMFITEILEIANLLRDDRDDIVQKGYGWLLKVASQAHQETIFNYVLSNKSIMSRTALRYAIEKLPLEKKAEAMKK